MSTEIRDTRTGEWVCTRWAGRPDAQAFDFGTIRRFDALFNLSLEEPNRELLMETGQTCTLANLFDGSLTGRHGCMTPTFAEFCGTVELGSGELLDRMGWEGS